MVKFEIRVDVGKTSGNISKSTVKIIIYGRGLYPGGNRVKYRRQGLQGPGEILVGE